MYNFCLVFFRQFFSHLTVKRTLENSCKYIKWLWIIALPPLGFLKNQSFSSLKMLVMHTPTINFLKTHVQGLMSVLGHLGLYSHNFFFNSQVLSSYQNINKCLCFITNYFDLELIFGIWFDSVAYIISCPHF